MMACGWVEGDQLDFMANPDFLANSMEGDMMSQDKQVTSKHSILLLILIAPSEILLSRGIMGKCGSEICPFI